MGLILLWVFAGLVVVFLILTFTDWLSDEKFKLNDQLRAWYLVGALVSALLWCVVYEEETGKSFGLAITTLGIFIAFVIFFWFVWLRKRKG